MNECKYSGYGIGFDLRSGFSLTDESPGKSVITFGANMSSSAHINNKNKDILVLGEGQHRDKMIPQNQQKVNILLIRNILLILLILLNILPILHIQEKGLR